MPLSLADIAVATPTDISLAERYVAFGTMFDSDSAETKREALGAWDKQRREFETWQALVDVRFHQDTADRQAKLDRDYADKLKPTAIGLETAFKRRVLAEDSRSDVERMVGSHLTHLWEADVATFAPAIAEDVEQEARLGARYTEILASARINIDGKTINLAGLAPYLQHLDRSTRHQAEHLRWDFFAANGPAFDAVFDDLVKLRHTMARKLGYESFTQLAYRRMRRVDYGPAEVARYRDEIVDQVVPLITDISDRRRADAGWDRLYAWDENLLDPLGNPTPSSGADDLVAQARLMFSEMDSSLGQLFGAMADGGFLDLETRPAKAAGGFCNGFPTHGMPFVFGNFNGTHHDVTVLTHETGHAFQYWSSLDQPSVDYLWPTAESAEIHSMALEFLTHPWMERLFGEAGERFRRMHLLESLAALPYYAAVDHFQHLIYAAPEASPAARHEMWQSVERRYLPWRDWGDLAYPAMGGRWQAQLHIYTLPFYYIDYALALCCALQLWARSLTRPAAALADYVALCRRGGSLPFQDLVRSANLVSPFVPGALAAVVAAARQRLAS